MPNLTLQTSIKSSSNLQKNVVKSAWESLADEDMVELEKLCHPSVVLSPITTRVNNNLMRQSRELSEKPKPLPKLILRKDKTRNEPFYTAIMVQETVVEPMRWVVDFMFSVEYSIDLFVAIGWFDLLPWAWRLVLSARSDSAQLNSTSRVESDRALWSCLRLNSTEFNWFHLVWANVASSEHFAAGRVEFSWVVDTITMPDSTKLKRT